MEEKKQLPDEVRAFFSAIGKKNGDKLMKERGSEYFKAIAAKRKRPFGKPRKTTKPAE